MFKQAKDVFDGGCKETFLNYANVGREEKALINNKKGINSKPQMFFAKSNNKINY